MVEERGARKIKELEEKKEEEKFSSSKTISKIKSKQTSEFGLKTSQKSDLGTKVETGPGFIDAQSIKTLTGSIAKYSPTFVTPFTKKIDFFKKENTGDPDGGDNIS